MYDSRPSIGRIVTYRPRTGGYDVPAIITATVETLSPTGVDLGHVPPLSSPEHVHLTVLTPGKPGTARPGNEVQLTQTSGTYQEWDIPKDLLPPEHAIVPGERAEPNPGTWRWPERV